ncbi:DNA-directed RNA polymerase II subunit RPB1-like [Sipha flava]|uniref:DNA-directed RNA polymerase II subunit RPB1-like n=1 Tax=Sipha flava TaxID=143950 RepID=A0A8B8G1A8_9HEMI|nr:DNA-directed RNA polymerase II subunit RPB1-like [Sipha flava]
MKVSCAAVLLTTVVAAVTATSSTSDKSNAVPSPVHQSASYQGPAAVAYPGPSYQFAAEYSSPFAKSAFGPKAVPSSFGAYQPYSQQHQQQHQQYNYVPYPQYFPASGYPAAAAVPYPSAYSSAQPAAVAASYPSPYTTYPYAAQPYAPQPYAAQPYHGASYSSYPFSSYNGQFVPAFASPYNGHFVAAPAPTATSYSALPSAYQPQQPSFFNAAATATTGQQYNPSHQYSPSQQFQSQQYPAFNPNPSPVAAASAASAVFADPAKASTEKK